jgi:hypothetical protein
MPRQGCGDAEGSRGTKAAQLNQPVSPYAPFLDLLPTANKRPLGQPTGTDQKPTGVTLRSCRLRSQPRARRSARPERADDNRLSPLIRPSMRRIRPSICPIRPCLCPIRPFLGFVASGRARWL